MVRACRGECQPKGDYVLQGSVEIVNSRQDSVTDEVTRLTVFDFDGTCINGNSPVLLFRYLVAKRMLDVKTTGRIIWWASKYKFHLPQNESLARGLMFSAFDGMPSKNVDDFLHDFYYSHIEKRFRKDAQTTIDYHQSLGETIVLLSATFEPIALCAKELHHFDYQLSTKMKKRSDGTYTREVEGRPMEGIEKLCAFTAFANEQFGKGKWKLVNAYGDHYSDITFLSTAEHPHAVSPDSTLERFAKEHGWPILNW